MRRWVWQKRFGKGTPSVVPKKEASNAALAAEVVLSSFSMAFDVVFT